MTSADKPATGGAIHCAIWDPDEVPREALENLVPHWVDRHAWFEWKHFQSPFGPAILHLAWEAGHDLPIGVVALGRTRTTTTSGTTIPTAFIYETFTQPEFRGRGVLTALLTSIEDSAPLAGLDAVFALPNPMARRGYQKSHYAPVLPARAWVKPTAKTLTHPRRLKQLAGSGGFRTDPPRAADAAGLSNGVPLGTVHTARDETVWRWRLGGQPVSAYDTVRLGSGWAVIRTGMRGSLREVQILSVLRDPGSRASLRTLLRQTAKSVADRADLVSFLSMGHDQGPHLLAAGFAPAHVANTLRIRAFTSQAAQHLDGPWAFDGLDIHTW
jgi:GNAT superfamily N-acetyltransferase